MRIRAALLVAALTVPDVARAEDVAAAALEPLVIAAFDLDRALPGIAQSLAAAPDVFDVQLAQAILGELGTATRLPAPTAPGQRPGTALHGPHEPGPGIAALGKAILADGPIAVNWQQRLDGAALAGRLGVSHTDGPVEMRFDLNSRVPLTTPRATQFGYDTSAFVRVLPALKIGATARGTLQTPGAMPTVEAMGPEAKLSLPALGGTFDAQAGWHKPILTGEGPSGNAATSQPGVLKWGLSFHKTL